MKTPLLALTLATGLVALPAMAQDLCSGLGAAGQWIGGTEAASDIATTDAAEQQNVLVLGGGQYVSLFSLSSGADVRIEAAAAGVGDPTVYLFSAEGAVLGTDDDSGGNGAARLETTLQPGTYCVAVQSFSGDPLSGFVRIGRTDQEPLTTGVDTDTTTTTTSSGDAQSCSQATMAGYFGDGGPVDSILAAGISGSASAADLPFWRFTLAEPQALTITASNTDADPFITLFDAQDSWLAENDDYDGLNSQIDMTAPLPAGDYCIGVKALNDASQPITLTLKAYDAEAARLGVFDRAEAAPPLDGSYPVTDLGTVPPRSRQDVTPQGKAQWFKLDIDQAGLLMIEAVAVSDGGDPYLVIFDDLGRKVVENDDYGSYNSMAVARVLPGSYLVAVKHLDPSQTGMIRLLIERYVPAN